MTDLPCVFLRGRTTIGYGLTRQPPNNLTRTVPALLVFGQVILRVIKVKFLLFLQVVKFKKIEVFLLQIRGKITAAASSTSVDFGAAFSA
jgi:hypothetical protein